MHKEVVVNIYNEISLIHKKNKTMIFVATWIDLKIVILSEVRERQLSYIAYMWNLKND